MNWFTGLFGYAEMILPLCRDEEKRFGWQTRINTIKTPMQELHEGTPPDNTKEMLDEAKAIAKEMIAYFRAELEPAAQAA